jgi:hypothetical protein
MPTLITVLLLASVAFGQDVQIIKRKIVPPAGFTVTMAGHKTDQGTYVSSQRVNVSGGVVGHLYAVVSTTDAWEIDSVTDSLNQTYTCKTRYGLLGSQRIAWCYTVLTGAPSWVQTNLSGSSEYLTITVLDISSGIVDQDAGLSLAYTTDFVSSSFTPAVSGELCLIGFMDDWGGVPTFPAGFTSDLASPETYMVPWVGHGILSGAGPQTTGVTIPSALNGSLAVLTVRPQ